MARPEEVELIVSMVLKNENILALFGFDMNSPNSSVITAKLKSLAAQAVSRLL